MLKFEIPRRKTISFLAYALMESSEMKLEWSVKYFITLLLLNRHRTRPSVSSYTECSSNATERGEKRLWMNLNSTRQTSFPSLLCFLFYPWLRFNISDIEFHASDSEQSYLSTKPISCLLLSCHNQLSIGYDFALL